MPFILGLILLVFAAGPSDTRGSKLIIQNPEVTIFSPAVLEPIRGTNDRMNGELDISNRTFKFTIQTSGFSFRSKLMERHFNEEYMETHLYPEAIFEGTYNEMINLSEPGEYEVNATGNLIVHGVSRQRTIPSKIIIESGKIRVESKFIVLFKEHNIKIPTLFFNDYATQVEVTVNSGLILVHDDQISN